MPPARDRPPDYERLPRLRRTAADLGHEIPRRAPTLRRSRDRPRSRGALRGGSGGRDPLLERGPRREPPSLGQRDRSRRSRREMPEDYRVQLVPGEYEPGGVFHALHCWLDSNLARYGFFRPYGAFRGGVRPEPWHVSYAAVAVPALASFSPGLLAEAVESSDMLGKSARPEAPRRHLRALRRERRRAAGRRRDEVRITRSARQGERTARCESTRSDTATGRSRSSVSLLEARTSAVSSTCARFRARGAIRISGAPSSSARCPAAGIEYVWEGARLGGRRRPRADSPHVALRNASFRAYADHMESAEFREGVERRARSRRTRTVAIMCAERLPWQCHRYMISDYLVAHGVEVRHVIDATTPKAHACGARRGSATGASSTTRNTQPGSAMAELELGRRRSPLTAAPTCRSGPGRSRARRASDRRSRRTRCRR